MLSPPVSSREHLIVGIPRAQTHRSVRIGIDAEDGTLSLEAAFAVDGIFRVHEPVGHFPRGRAAAHVSSRNRVCHLPELGSGNFHLCVYYGSAQ